MIMKKTIILILLLVFMRANVYCQKSVQYYGSHCVTYDESGSVPPNTGSLAGSRIKVFFDSDGDPTSFETRDMSMAGTPMPPKEYEVGWLIDDEDDWNQYSYDSDYDNYDDRRILISHNKKVVCIHHAISVMGSVLHTLSYYGKTPTQGGGGNYGSGGLPGGGIYGGIPDNSGSGSSSGSTYRTCRGCGGSGNCTGCGGEGKYWVDGYYGRSRVNCGSCGGSGRCRVCYGKGRL